MQTRASFILIFLFIMLSPMRVSSQIVTGAEQMDQYMPLLKGKRIGMVVNHTSVVGAKRVHLLDTLLRRDVRVVKAFAPEHGFRGNADAGETVKDGKDSRTSIPIVSLYGDNKKPSATQLKDVDVILFDIQDVGARFYTYISTMYYVMDACAENKKEMIVLDRPNPCDYVDGPILKPAYRSFVGMLPIPVLHGCTIGELAQMINGEGWIANKKNPCSLKVIPMTGWKHGEPYSLPIKPSPNLPNDQSIRLYASLCPFEATRVSVGRGTTFPFQVLGAPNKKYGSFVSVSAMPSPPSKKIEVASPLYVSILLLFSFHLSGNKFLYTFMSVFGGSFAALLITSVIYSKVFIPCILHEQASE